MNALDGVWSCTSSSRKKTTSNNVGALIHTSAVHYTRIFSFHCILNIAFTLQNTKNISLVSLWLIIVTANDYGRVGWNFHTKYNYVFSPIHRGMNGMNLTSKAIIEEPVNINQIFLLPQFSAEPRLRRGLCEVSPLLFFKEWCTFPGPHSTLML